MKDKELKKVLNFIEQTDGDGKDEITEIILRAAAESITLEKVKSLSLSKEEKKNDKNGQSGFIKFTPKEIEKMPEKFKKLFTVNDKVVSYRIVRNSYQARYRRLGISIEVSGKTFKEMKQRFIERLLDEEKKKNGKDFPLFKESLRHWLIVKEKTVKESTYKGYKNTATCHLLPKFGETPVNEIKRHDIQVFLFEFVDAGKARTAQKLKIMLKEIFDMLNEDYDLKTPMKKIVLAHHEAKKGRAFTKEEEKRIVDFCKENPHFYGNSALLLLMYTGMRVGEMPSHWIDGEFICCVSEKTRKGYNEVVRKIPMSPMLKKVLPLIDFEATKVMSRFTVRDALKRIYPDRHIHEFRYTFITRAKECDCNPETVMLWVGHEFGLGVKTSRVDRGYTTFSDEYFLKEINKIDYEL